MADQKYPGCWYCDNIIDHPEQVGLLYLGFPRCFVLIPSIGDFYFSTYEEFLNGLCKVNWLDPSNKGTREEQEEVLRILWNFQQNKKKKKKNYMEIMMNDRERIGKKLAEIRNEKVIRFGSWLNWQTFVRLQSQMWKTVNFPWG